MKPKTYLTVFLLSMASAGLALHADTIFSDSLTTSTSTNLSGTKPTDRGGIDTPGTSYTVGGGVFSTTSAGAVPSDVFPIAELAFPTITANSGTYTLTADIDLNSGNNGGNDAEIGFDTNTNPDEPIYINGPSGPILQLNDDGESRFADQGDGNPGNSNYSPYSNDSNLATYGENTVGITIDTDGAYYTISAEVNGKSDGSYTYSASDPAPSIDEIFIGSQGTLDVSFTNLQLTQTPAVPEPSTWALLGAGALSLAVLTRARRRNS